ncbi:hypothetical protein MKS88_004285 [Plasmodium brasilianum]|uniref:DUF1279 domain-containing protein n=2 Tax=Plasmodium (Plasmodium) TaxID=418103 RepID=A0A1D3SPC7_PLAMA|nr:conserved Plasmodium protein, unknown function [Plasmodium malariae]KAI4836488.1 hypothetical protein MKS88_004285 [Plasmodium brasilianum]SCO93764.1 conserved Plasmodium protein, unknown function [Plasmodium malariae]
MLNHLRTISWGGKLKGSNKIKVLKDNLKRFTALLRVNENPFKYIFFPKKPVYVGSNRFFFSKQNENDNKSVGTKNAVPYDNIKCTFMFNKSKWFKSYVNINFFGKKKEFDKNKNMCSNNTISGLSENLAGGEKNIFEYGQVDEHKYCSREKRRYGKVNGVKSEGNIRENRRDNDKYEGTTADSNESKRKGRSDCKSKVSNEGNHASNNVLHTSRNIVDERGERGENVNGQLQNIAGDTNDNEKGKKKKIILFKGTYFKNVHSLLLSKKIKETLTNLKSRHGYKIIMKRIKIEKKKINYILTKYHIISTGNVKYNLNEHIYRKAVINTKTKIFTFLKRYNNKSLIDIYYEEKTKYKVRKQKLYELQEKIIKNSKIAQSSVKKFFKKYGYVGLGTYFIVFLMTFCSSYFFVHFKYISLSDLKYISEKMHLNKYIDDDLHKKIDSVWGEILFAYIASKIAEPLRIVITILITPYIAKVIKLKKRGRLKSL